MECVWDIERSNEVAAYAVDAVWGERADAIAAHLPGCETCGFELAAHREALADLTPDLPEAGASLWDAIEATISRNARRNPVLG